MMMIGIVGLTFLTCVVLYWRVAVEERAIRWELYARRDELRLRAFEDAEIRSSEVFRRLDETLTKQCATFDNLSLWSIVPIALFGDPERASRKQRDFETKLRQPQNEALVPIYHASVALFARHLMWRHLFLTLASVVTIVGVVVVYVTAKWLAGKVVSGAVKPVPSAVPALAP